MAGGNNNSKALHDKHIIIMLSINRLHSGGSTFISYLCCSCLLLFLLIVMLMLMLMLKLKLKLKLKLMLNQHELYSVGNKEGEIQKMQEISPCSANQNESNPSSLN